MLENKVTLTRQHLLSVALEVMLEQQGNLSITAVCKTAGVTRTTLYRYFPNREELIRGVFEEFHERFAQGLRAAIEQSPQAEERLDVVISYMNQYMQDNGVYHLMDTSPAFITVLVKRAFEQRVALYVEVLAPYFDLIEKLQGGSIDRKLVAFTLQNLFASVNLLSEPFMPYSLDELLKKTVTAMVQLR